MLFATQTFSKSSDINNKTGGDVFKVQNQRDSAAACECPGSHKLSTRVCTEGRGAEPPSVLSHEPELETKQELSPDAMKKQTGNLKKGFPS